MKVNAFPLRVTLMDMGCYMYLLSYDVPCLPIIPKMMRDPTWKALPTHKIPERILELRVVKRKGAAQMIST